jgi:UDP-N-acetylmuramoyl-L-alanyl-D-glutamate--2,6-diaminopimelate ligase
MAANYYGDPSQNLKKLELQEQMVKRLSLLYYINYLKKAGFKVGLLSTVKIMVDTVEYKATHNSDSITINQYLNEMSEG